VIFTLKDRAQYDRIEFDCAEFYSEFQALEVTRHTPLTDKMSLHYFELPKLPKTISKDSELLLWLSLFNANTEEDFKRLEALEAPDMEQAISAYRHITATDEFKEIERIRSRARHNEAAALRHATEIEREKWQVIVAEKDAENQIALAEKDTALAEKDAENEMLRRQIAELQAKMKED